MSMSSGNPGGAVPGLQLWGWALVKIVATVATIVKGQNIAAVNRTALGVVTATFTTAAPSNEYTNDGLTETPGSALQISAKTTAGFTINLYSSYPTNSDLSMFYVAIYV